MYLSYGLFVASPPLIVARIEDIDSLLIEDLGIERNVRKRRVGISRTNYKSLDNEYQIKEALTDMCDLVNCKENTFGKALLTLPNASMHTLSKDINHNNEFISHLNIMC
ncbi:MAG: hypothetical protein GQ540_02440 [Lutibacter sp.]|uniref:hypothetical protein n=1 Tax=Lutibacter sp. TaxID=1925666 RepID=UPI001A0A1CBB|nr:hypothetical protein [Lutibacter sp.]NOR27366.1 hypothetical protein [Lutibacter sp.]